MNQIKIEVGKHIDDRPEVTYVIQLIKFYDRKFDTGTVIKEFVLQKGHTIITAVNVR